MTHKNTTRVGHIRVRAPSKRFILILSDIHRHRRQPRHRLERRHTPTIPRPTPRSEDGDDVSARRVDDDDEDDDDEDDEDDDEDDDERGVERVPRNDDDDGTTDESGEGRRRRRRR